MRAALRREDAVHARLRGFRARCQRAVTLLQEAQEQHGPLIVALSGGKDSLVCLALARMAGLSPLAAIWTDDELEYGETVEAVPRIAAQLGATLISKTGTQRHAEWFVPWTLPPYWRDPLPGTLVTRERSFQVRRRLGYRGAVLGIRREESAVRAIAARRWQAVHEVAGEGWYVWPVLDWPLRDIWAAIAEWDLPYNPVYDRLAEIGVPRERQRVGPLPLSEGWMLRDGWPLMWRRLIERYGRRWG